MPLTCPISGLPLKAARAKGGAFWYSPHSRGRLLTLSMAKHFLGQDGARELWVRSERSPESSPHACPSCLNPMRLVNEPQWLGGHEIDVCRRCHLIWIDPEEHGREVPHPEDLLGPRGDSTVAHYVGESLAETIMKKDEHDRDKSDLVGEGPEGFLERLPAFLGLPVKMESPRASEKWWVTISLIVAMVLIHIWVSNSPAAIAEYGFYPDDPFKNFGFNFLASNFLHAGWFHLIFNLYFFLLLSNDIEERLGLFRYFVLLASVCFSTSFFALLASGSPDLPHVGLSGIIMGFMAVYALLFPRVRFAYLISTAHPVSFGRGSVSWMRGIGWLRLPIWVITGVYLVGDVVSYFAFESRKLGSTSHSGHIGGAIGGLIFYFFFWLTQRQANLLPVPVEATPRKQLRPPVPRSQK
ncbi:MAG TPA: rhomboid family intramembrane serine protease [bacterium]|nr:rhomboid family intramembrane serine protease [bacterium]